MSHVESWIRPYLKRYVASISPHDFPDGTDPDEVSAFVEGWSYAFRLAHPPITEAEADAARLRLAMHPPAFRRDHLPAVVAVVLGMRERDAQAQLHRALERSPAEARAVAESRGCPECKGTGWARRRGVWRDRSWSAMASLYCRCPMGRLRLAGDAPGPANYDDLQAMPSLWDRSLSHPSWSGRPTEPASVEGREWEYQRAGDPAPPPIVPERRLGPPVRQYPDWMKKPEPAVPIPAPVRPKPTPEPAPVAWDGDEEIPFD